MGILGLRLNRWLPQSLLAGLLVGLMAEISIHPFGTAFRFSLGPVALSFVALFFAHLPSYLTGLTAGLLVPLVHAAFALAQQPDLAAAGVYAQIGQFLPETLAYTMLGSLLYLFRVPERTNNPFTLMLLLALADVATNTVELFLRGEPHDLLQSLFMMSLVALGRALVAEGAYYVLQEGVREQQWAAERRRYAGQVLFLANLQTEAFFLQKSAREMEQVMAKAHRLYRKLAGHSHQPLALEVATDIHEVKKDAQRTLAALYRLVETPKVQPTMTLQQMVGLVLDANQTYATTLGKEITLQTDLRVDFCTARFGRWISILNNLVSNAIEACGKQGTVSIAVERRGPALQVQVTDTGSGIQPEDWDLIFSPGFTTKLDSLTGSFTNGIGLSHVAGLADEMNGAITVTASEPGHTVLRLTVPWDALEVESDAAVPNSAG